jgi:hypothetical protein
VCEFSAEVATYLSEGKMFRTEVVEKIDTHACCLIHCSARFKKKRHVVITF